MTLARFSRTIAAFISTNSIDNTTEMTLSSVAALLHSSRRRQQPPATAYLIIRVKPELNGGHLAGGDLFA